MKIYEKQIKSMKINENLFKSMGIHFNLFVSGGRGVHGNGQKSYQNWNKNKLILRYCNVHRTRNDPGIIPVAMHEPNWDCGARVSQVMHCNKSEILSGQVTLMYDPSERPQTGEIYGFGLDSNRI